MAEEELIPGHASIGFYGADPIVPEGPLCPRCNSTDFTVLDRAAGDRSGHFEACDTCGYLNMRVRIPTDEDR